MQRLQLPLVVEDKRHGERHAAAGATEAGIEVRQGARARRKPAGMDAGDTDEVKAFGGEAPGDGFPGIGSLLEKGEAREIREVERERNRGSK